MDIASLGLLSFDAEELSLGDQIALAIDHHGSNDLNAPKLVEADRAACGEIILELLELLGVTLTEKLANALYLAISTDTGCFKYSNTTAHTHEAAAKLIHAGADTYPINKAFFDTKSFARLRLEAGADALHRALRGRPCGALHDAEIAIAGAGHFRGRRGLHLGLCALH